MKWQMFTTVTKSSSMKMNTIAAPVSQQRQSPANTCLPMKVPQRPKDLVHPTELQGMLDEIRTGDIAPEFATQISHQQQFDNFQISCTQIKEILGKMTKQNGGAPIYHLRTIIENEKSLNNENNLNKVVNIIFEKAVETIYLSDVYANVIKNLALIQVQSNCNVNEYVYFRQLIIIKCQFAFESYLSKQCIEKNTKAQKRALGTITLIGQLYKLKMFNDTIVLYCLKSLVHQGKEHSLECFSILFTLIATYLEDNSLRQLNTYCKDIEKIINKGLISPTTRFLLEDLLENKQKIMTQRNVNNDVVDDDEFAIVSWDSLLETRSETPETAGLLDRSILTTIQEFIKKSGLQFAIKSYTNPNISPEELKIELTSLFASIVFSVSQNVTLNKSEYPWKPNHKAVGEDVNSKTEANKSKPFENRPPSLSGLPKGVSNVPDFKPGYVKSRKPKNVRIAQTPGTSVSQRSQQGNKTEPKNERSVVLSFNQNVKLNKAENAWKPTHKDGKDDTETVKTENLYKRVRGILNKLTPQKFQAFVNQIKDLSIDTEERLKGVIDLVFEKALDEPNFSVSYANLCKCLAMKRVPIGGNGIGFVNFRKLLLNKCQKEFEKDITDEVAKVKRDIETGEADENKKRGYKEELKELERKAKRRSLGNIRFLGELFKLHMLTAGVMHDCLKKFLSQEDEYFLECLCRLLTTIGKDMDSKKGKATKESDNRMDSYFRQMQEIVRKHQTSSRVRFMLQDVMELRLSNWVPRWNENNPRTLDQIHLESERETFERELQLSQPPAQHRRIDDKRKRSGVGGGGSSSMGEDGWNTVGSKNSSCINPEKLKLSKKIEVDDDIQLASGYLNSVGWSRGGSRTSSQEPENKSSVPTNRFQALAVDQSVTVDSRRGVNQNPPPSTRDLNKGRSNQMVFAAQRGSKTSLKEREQAIAAVKAIAAAETGRAYVGSSRENSTTREEKKDSVLKGSPDLSEEEIAYRAKPILHQFLRNTDFQEAILCISELCAPATIHFFVTTGLNFVLERSVQTRQLIGQMMRDLVKTKVMTTEQYIKGLQAILSRAEDYAIDIPHIWEHLGELIAPLVKGGTMPLSFLSDAAQPCLETGCAGNFVTAVLHAVAKKVGKDEVNDLWRSSNLQWSQFLPPTINIQEFVEDNELEFTLNVRSPCNIFISPEQLKAELTTLFTSTQPEIEEIFNSIDANLNESSFVHALMIAVCQSVLKKNDVSCSVEDKIMFAGTLPGWEARKVLSEQEGKRVALRSVRSFYIWLNEM